MEKLPEKKMKSILVVDDNQDDRFFIRRLLELNGYQVVEAESGIKAIEHLTKTGAEIDLILTDIIMPEMDGVTLARKIRKIMPGIKVVFVSGVVRNPSRVMEMDQIWFMTKGDQFSQLIPTVTEAFKEASSLKALLKSCLS